MKFLKSLTVLRSVKNTYVKGKRILLRVDFNVLVKNGKVADAYRIERVLPTIKFLKRKGAKIILISHLTAGRAKTLRPMAEYLNKYFSVKFFGGKNLDLIKKKICNIKNGDVVMLENIRIHDQEEKNGKKFAKQMAQLGDIFVNDAFSASHRNHASIVGFPKYLPAYMGLCFEEELENLKNAFKPERPFLFVLGGVKFESKLGVLEKFLKIADKIFIGGALANNFFKLKKMEIGSSVIDEKVSVKKYLNNSKIILPIDVKRENNKILDAGPETIKELEELVKKSKFILWNGPIGDYERKGFENGTRELAKIIAKSRSVSIIGGGDTIAAVNKFENLKKFSFVSTAGGAMLAFLAKGTLPGIEALKKRNLKK